MTEKLYYADSHMKGFTANVMFCEYDGKHWCVELDRTAFFPEGGGQAADSGYIGDVKVFDVQEKDGKILHYTECELAQGPYVCSIDWEQRFRRMQNHSGEHIVSGLINKRFGYDNVGFHLAEDYVTLDFNGELSAEDIAEIELSANKAVWENVRIFAEFPAPEVLDTLNYRSKLELTEDVRIVTVEGYDVCACCAPHVSRTGEIGVIKITDSMKHRGGVRLTMLCGIDAYKDYARKQEAAAEISALLSAKRDDIAPAVKKFYNDLQNEKYQSAELKKTILKAEGEKLTDIEGNYCFFYPATFDINSLRILVNEAMKHCNGIAAAFSGSDGAGYNYVMGSAHVDLRVKSKEINAAISGRGGGSPEMIQGSSKALRTDIENYFNN